MHDLERFRAQDARLVEAAKDIKVLSAIAWPAAIGEAFLADWRAGRPRLPVPPPPDRRGLVERIDALEALSRPIADHPIARFIARTAESYLVAARMLAAAGTPDFAALSIDLYGHPADPVSPRGLTSIDAARQILEVSADLARSCFITEADYCLTPDAVAAAMRPRLEAFFTRHAVAVKIDPELTAKAAAGAEAVRLRGGASFSQADLHQLLEHEAYVHTATLLNGREQPLLRSLSLGAPRTTATQEGLATFAELITTTLDLSRLRRIALRIPAVHMALEGADFVEVFRFFLENGQTEGESYSSTARVFRGGDPRGRVAFTKDTVYLRGLLRTIAFLHAALAARKVEYTHYLFAGRVTWGDVLDLEPYFAAGALAGPIYEPAWLAAKNELATYLAFSGLTHRLPLEDARLADFAEDRPTLTNRLSRTQLRLDG